MPIKAEIYNDKVYILTSWGDVWKIKFEINRSPIIERIAQADPNQIRLIAGPTLPRLFEREFD